MGRELRKAGEAIREPWSLTQSDGWREGSWYHVGLYGPGCRRKGRKADTTEKFWNGAEQDSLRD